MTPQQKREAWDFAIGLQAADDKTASPELLALVEKEISGKITTGKIIEKLRKLYTTK